MKTTSPLLKLVLIASLVAGAVYGADRWLDWRAAQPRPAPASAPASAALPPPAEAAAPLPPPLPQPATLPSATAPIPTLPQGAPFDPAPGSPGVGIATGDRTGTNYPIGQDIARVCPQLGIRVEQTVGSLENVYRIYSDPRVQYGIVQEDALRYLEAYYPTQMGRIKMVFPFFLSDFHLIVRADAGIQRLEDLAGRRVVTGPAKSGTWVTTERIKQVTGLGWQEQSLPQGDGLNALLGGRADAMFFVAGTPIGSLRDLGAHHREQLRLVSLSHPALDPLYPRATIPAGTYPWQPEAVPTYTVRTALATFDYKRSHQDNIRGLVGCITRQLEELKRTGHPRWREVDLLDIDKLHWPVHPAARQAIRDARRGKSAPADFPRYD